MDSKVTIIGCGPGNPDLLTIRGRQLIDTAHILIGSGRLLESMANETSAKLIKLESNYQEILEKADKLRKYNDIVFLVSGDPLFNSFGETIINKFGKDSCEVIPGISSFQSVYCYIKESWKDHTIISLHGKEEIDIDNIFKNNDKLIVLLDPKHNLKFIKNRSKVDYGKKYEFILASNITLENEVVNKISFKDFDTIKEESLSILIVTSIGDARNLTT